MIIIDVILPIPIPKYFSYLLPLSTHPVIGGRVVVPLYSKDVIGIVIAIHSKKNVYNFKYKFVKYVIDDQPIFNTSLLNFLIWLSQYYCYPIGNIFLLIIPQIFKLKKIKFNKYNNKLYLNKNKNQINLFKINHKFFLNKKILLKINEIIIKNTYSVWLMSEMSLYIKVKFYLGLFEKILIKKLQILVIVPFIKDIYKILFILKKYFNVSIDIIHSDLSHQQFLNIWMKTNYGYNSIVIGTKKSIFLSFLKLGLIVIFEEHNLIYKNINRFRCNIKDIALFRSYKNNIPIILDSKTPSLKTLHNVVYKKISWIHFNKNDNILVLKHQVINLNTNKVRSGLSEILIQKIINNIKQGFSILLIFHVSDLICTSVICSYCNWIPVCNVCSGYYIINKYENILFCKNCLMNFKIPLFCYNCNFFPLTKINFGLKKIKNTIKNIFPNIPLLFLTNVKNIKIKKFGFNIIDFSILHHGIIISTEKIVQNYYFPTVRLISLINVDYYLFALNFYNIENFSQFYYNLPNLIQKNSKFLNILIQTYNPNNKNLINICNQSYFFCARHILNIRKKFLLPPWRFQIVLYCISKNFRKSYDFLKFIYIFLKKKSNKDNIVLWFLGPSPVFSISKKQYCYKLLMQCYSPVYLHKTLRMSIKLSQYFSIFSQIQWFIDFNIN